MTVRISLIASIMLVFTGCSSPPGVFYVSVDEAYRRLASSRMLDLRNEHQCGILIHFHPEGVPGRSVTWRVRSSGIEVLTFRADLKPLGENKTRVDVAIQRDPDGSDAYDGSDFYARPALRQPARPAIEEQVAALLEGRSYDRSRLPPEKEQDSICLLHRSMLEEGAARYTVLDPEAN